LSGSGPGGHPGGEGGGVQLQLGAIEVEEVDAPARPAPDGAADDRDLRCVQEGDSGGEDVVGDTRGIRFP